MEPPTVSVAPDAETVDTAPLTIEIPPGWRARGCTISLSDADKPVADAVDGVDVVVQHGGITVQVRRHDGSQSYESGVLPATPDGYTVRLPELHHEGCAPHRHTERFARAQIQISDTRLAQFHARQKAVGAWLPIGVHGRNRYRPARIARGRINPANQPDIRRFRARNPDACDCRCARPGISRHFRGAPRLFHM